jgi:hypothetical protein
LLYPPPPPPVDVIDENTELEPLLPIALGVPELIPAPPPPIVIVIAVPLETAKLVA